MTTYPVAVRVCADGVGARVAGASLAPHAVVGPGVLEAVRVADRDDMKLGALSKQAKHKLTYFVLHDDIF